MNDENHSHRNDPDYLARSLARYRGQVALVRGGRSEQLVFYTAPPEGQTHYLRLNLVAAVFTNTARGGALLRRVPARALL